MKYAIVDIETTGGNFKSGRITEVAVFLHNGASVIDSYQTLVNPEMPIPPFVSNLTGITDDMVADAPTFPEIANKLLNITNDAIFIAHNVNFDYGYIREAYRQMGIEFKRKKLCTVQMSRKAFPGLPSYSLDKITRELGIRLPGHHRAAVDAEATTRLFEKILERENQHGLFDSSVGIPDTDKFESPLIDRDFLTSIPDECGIFRFYDRADRIIFAKRAENMLTSICDKLGQTETQTSADLQKSLYRIDYEHTGSGLLAQLLEANDVAEYNPEFNFGRFSMKVQFGLYVRKAENTSQILLMKRRRGSKPERVFTTFFEGLEYLKTVAETTNTEITQLPYGRKSVPGILGHLPKLAFPVLGTESYVVIDEGRHVSERCLVLVEAGMVKGYGYYDVETPVTDFSPGEMQVRFNPHPELELVVRKFIEKKRFERVLKLN